MNGYDKLRLRIKELEEEKRILIEEPFSEKSISINLTHSFQKEVQSLNFQGVSEEAIKGCDGFLKSFSNL